VEHFELMEILKYEKIKADFNPWNSNYIDVANSIIDLISNERFTAIHIGSTSFKVGGKGIIDLSILYGNGDLNAAVSHLLSFGFQDQISDTPFPSERPRKDGAVITNGKKYFLHVHCIAVDSQEHQKQLQYKNYMLNNPDSRKEYELSKKQILHQGVTEQEAYGKLKSPYVKSVLAQLK
jgi:GrpB-like predicted nucleotidyltransferase (UPF0157 family)